MAGLRSQHGLVEELRLGTRKCLPKLRISTLLRCSAQGLSTRSGIRRWRFGLEQRFQNSRRVGLGWLFVRSGLGNLAPWSRAPDRCLSLVVRLSLVEGCINGHPKTLVCRVEATSVLQVQRGDGGRPYQRLSCLADLVAAGAAEARSPFVNAAVAYSDLVLGIRWRGLR